MSLRGLSAEGAYLDGISLKGADLRYSNLRKASLQKAAFQEATLTNTNLQNALLYEADFRKANLQGVNFEGAVFNTEVAFGGEAVEGFVAVNPKPEDIFVGANLSGANFKNTSVSRVAIEKGYLCNTTMPDGSKANRDCAYINSIDK
ncbi:pentapeptide repeat-containing protein [Leptolyngbya sp. FACHB-711]|uniref:pentapeptide repeat-containing protein n=1 Tax=Leptolyngbya sp. FACHB-711 TaxID=2692813 RepID=UPI001683BD25|nr:pentapeptide repeat-containing protein [Cyanobacteria bacterium FACHB-502]MBD2028188.1 pentapeptide repeat-containing protein [Leptolyngbya sp. FACHB-711]